MPRAVHRDAIYCRRRYCPEIIEQCVRWYLTYRLSSRDLVTMIAERGIRVSHTTILRWVQCYVLEYERHWSRFSVAPGNSWRMDETEVRVRGRSHWLYRAVDRNGHSVHSLLCVNRTIESAKAFFLVRRGEAGSQLARHHQSRRERCHSSRSALAGCRGRALEERESACQPVPQQPHRAGSPCGETAMRLHARDESIQYGGRDVQRH